MSNYKIKQSLENLGKALVRLEEGINTSHPDSLLIDGTIQRFEFVIELYWKTLKRLLLAEGIETNTPRETLKQAFQSKWLEDETAWLQMLQDRNETSHIYNEATAVRIFNDIKKYYPELSSVYKKLLGRFPIKN